MCSLLLANFGGNFSVLFLSCLCYTFFIHRGSRWDGSSQVLLVKLFLSLGCPGPGITGSEFNPVQQPQLNEKVLKDKRKKLRETFERILRLYEKENPDIYKELRKLEVEYEQKRSQLSQYFDAVKVISSILINIPLIVIFAPIAD